MTHQIPVDAPIHGYARTRLMCLNQTYAEVLPDWIQATQLEAGMPCLEHRELALPGLEITYVWSAVASVERYTIPDGETHFTLDLDHSAPILSWAGHDSVRSARYVIAIHRSQVEYIAVTPPNWSCLYICMNDALLDRLDLLPPKVWQDSQDPRNAILEFEMWKLDRFRQFVRQWFTPFAHPHTFSVLSPIEAATLFTEFTETLQLLFDRHAPQGQAFFFDRPSRRYRNFRDACAWIEAHLATPLSIEAIAQELHIAPRALQYAFQDLAGTSVAKYIQARRLHGVRESLVSGVWPPGGGVGVKGVELEPIADDRLAAKASIGQIAKAYGFHHLGRFSQQFSRQFGVLPHELRSAIDR
jgi:AraC-like DNA-binding protein